MGRSHRLVQTDNQELSFFAQAFYINLVIGALFAPAYFLILPSIDLKAGTPIKAKLRMMDWVAITIFFAGTTCFTMAINFGGTKYAWDSGSEITLWVMSGVFLIAMVLATKYHPLVTAENKLYPAHFLKRFELVNLQVQLFLISGVMLVRIIDPAGQELRLIRCRQRLTSFLCTSSSPRYYSLIPPLVIC
jgi:hypothetical protein